LASPPIPAFAIVTVAVAFSRADKMVKLEVAGHALRPEKLAPDAAALKVPKAFASRSSPEA